MVALNSLIKNLSTEDYIVWMLISISVILWLIVQIFYWKETKIEKIQEQINDSILWKEFYDANDD